MTAPTRIWIWPNQSATGVIAWGSGCYRAQPHRPLDAKDGPTGAEYVSTDAVAQALDLLDRAVNGPWLDGDLERARELLAQARGKA